MSIFGPTPVPTPTQQMADAWNTNWNTAWNEGFTGAERQDPAGSQPIYMGNLPGGQEGFDAGIAEYYNRNPIGGSTTNNNASPVTTVNPPSGGDGGGGSTGGIPAVDMSFYPGWNNQAAIQADWAATWQQKTGQQSSGGGQSEVDRYRQQREGLVNQGWDAYTASLDKMLNEGLPGQRSALEGIAQNQQTMGAGALGVERDTGLTNLQGERQQVASNQATNLKDLAENMRNMMMAGNVYLGSQGAGDSSAANQYSYALSKLGSKARGDVTAQSSDQLAQIGQRETNLKTIYNQETRNLTTATENKTLEIAQWFAEQQNAIQSQIGQAGLGRSQDLAGLVQDKLNIALQELSRVEQESSDRRAALDQWAMSNSDNISQLKANMQQVGGFQASLPQVQAFSGAPVMNGKNINFQPGGGGFREREEEDNIFGGGSSRGSGASGSWA